MKKILSKLLACSFFLTSVLSSTADVYVEHSPPDGMYFFSPSQKIGEDDSGEIIKLSNGKTARIHKLSEFAISFSLERNKTDCKILVYSKEPPAIPDLACILIEDGKLQVFDKARSISIKSAATEYSLTKAIDDKKFEKLMDSIFSKKTAPK